MKATYLLVIFSYIAFCNGLSISPNSTAKEYCVEQCRDICVPCQEDPGCKDEQRECGLGKPDPAFGGVGSTCDLNRGIMSYSDNYNFQNPWSTCSKNEFQKHYNAILNLKMPWCLEGKKNTISLLK